jgi:hypothetical protein
MRISVPKPRLGDFETGTLDSAEEEKGDILEIIFATHVALEYSSRTRAVAMATAMVNIATADLLCKQTKLTCRPRTASKSAKYRFFSPHSL